MNKDKHPIDKEAVCLLKTVQDRLIAARDSLNGKTTQAEASYLVWGAIHITNTIAGYIVLRESRLLHASKLLVRPVLETTFCVRAALRQPGFLLQKAYSEHLEEAKIAARNDKELAELKSDVRAEFNRMLANQRLIRPSFPSVACEKVSVETAAKAADLLEAYHFDFRLYCQFMHGALRATSGDLDSLTDKRDTPLMIWCALIVLEEMKKHTPATVAELAPLWTNLRELPDPTAGQPQTDQS